MAAYVLSEIVVLDAEQLAEYRKLAGPSVQKYGGRYLVRGGAMESIEDEFGGEPHAYVVIEFESMERAREWYASPEYAAALEYRPAASRRRLLFLEGVPQ